MKKTFKKFLYGTIAIIAVVFLAALILAYFPVKSKTGHIGITPEKASEIRKNYKGSHEIFKASDGETLFIWRWNPTSIDSSKKDIAVLLLHGITAYGGAYKMAGEPISKGGYTTFALDYRGHGLSGGNRGDSPGKERWIADLAESVKYIKTLGFSKVVVLGHSLGVASSICVANAVPDEIAGLILLSGAYEGKKGVASEPTLFEKGRVLANSIFRPSYQAYEYYRKGMTVTKDSLFNFRYTLRFLTMLNVKELRLPKTLQIPILVGIGDKDELFTIEKVKKFYDLIPSHKKEFLIMKNSTHAKINLESWQEVVVWLDKTY